MAPNFDVFTAADGTTHQLDAYGRPQDEYGEPLIDAKGMVVAPLVTPRAIRNAKIDIKGFKAKPDWVWERSPEVVLLNEVDVDKQCNTHVSGKVCVVNLSYMPYATLSAKWCPKNDEEVLMVSRDEWDLRAYTRGGAFICTQAKATF